MLVKSPFQVRWLLFAVAAVGCASKGGTQDVKTASAAVTSGNSFTEFESGQVRPLALSPSGRLLFAVNTPDNRLEIFQVDSGKLRHLESIPVGLEPVSVAARNEHEVWVTNLVSDSVS